VERIREIRYACSILVGKSEGKRLLYNNVLQEKTILEWIIKARREVLNWLGHDNESSGLISGSHGGEYEVQSLVGYTVL
jgi:hypothetical protein